MQHGVAVELADALGSVVLDGLATTRDVSEHAVRLEGQIRETELRLRSDTKDLELRLMTRLGALTAGTTALTIAVLGALISLR